MKKRLNCIMLIDDNPADNWFHEIVIKEMDITDHIEIALDGEEALKFFSKENQIKPDLVFLDINMPKVNGWEFLEEYEKLSINQKAKIIIVMLTTSENPRDIERAKHIKEVTGYNSKPLTEELLKKILAEHFPDIK